MHKQKRHIHIAENRLLAAYLKEMVSPLCTRYDLSHLKILGSVGEPINPEAWHWYHQAVGQGRCPVVDTFWQTETVSVSFI